MKISVIIPFHNEIQLIDRAVNSVLMNSTISDDLEVLICNDGVISEQEIRGKLNSAANLVTKVIPNRYLKGPGGARNTGLDMARGDCIAFLDADDFWLPGKVAAQLLAIKSGATFVTTAYRFDTSNTVIVPPETIDRPFDIFQRRGIGTSTVMITRSLLADLRFKNMRFAQDIDYWYSLARSPHFQYAAINICSVEYSTEGSTKNKWVQMLYLYKVLRVNDVSWLQTIRVLSSYTLMGIFNHYIKRLFNRTKRYIRETR